jgi:hypothetical protein
MRVLLLRYIQYKVMPERRLRLGSNVAGFKVVADLELRHPPTITTQSYTV